MIYVISGERFHNIRLHSYAQDAHTGSFYILMVYEFGEDCSPYAVNLTLKGSGECFGTDLYRVRVGEKQEFRNITDRMSSSAMLRVLDAVVRSEAFTEVFGTVNGKSLYIERSVLYCTELGETIPGTYFYAHRFHYDLYAHEPKEKTWWLFGSFFWHKDGSIYELEMELDDRYNLTGYTRIHVDKPYKQHLISERSHVQEVITAYKEEIDAFIDRHRKVWQQRKES